MPVLAEGGRLAPPSAARCQAVVRKFSWLTEPPLIFLAMYINGTYTRGTSAAQCLAAFDDGIVFMVHITTSISVADHRSIEQDVAYVKQELIR